MSKIKKATKSQIDQYAELALQRAQIDKALRELRPAIVARGEGLQAGLSHVLNVTEVHGVSLSVTLAKAVMTAQQIAENARTVVEAVYRARPSSVKGVYVRSVTLSLTMSPPVAVELKEFASA